MLCWWWMESKGIEKKRGGKDGGVPSSSVRKKRAEEFRVKFRGGIARFQEKSPVRQRLSSGRKFTRGVTFWLNSGPPWNSDSFANGFTAFAAALSLSLRLHRATTGRSPIKPGKIRLNIFAPWPSRYEFSNEQSNEPLTRSPFDSKLNFRPGKFLDIYIYIFFYWSFLAILLNKINCIKFLAIFCGANPKEFEIVDFENFLPVIALRARFGYSHCPFAWKKKKKIFSRVIFWEFCSRTYSHLRKNYFSEWKSLSDVILFA